MKGIFTLLIAITLSYEILCKDVVELAEELGARKFSKLLREVLTTSASPKYTVFAPVDEAFDHLPGHVQDYLENNTTDLVKFHVIYGEYKRNDFVNGQNMATLLPEHKIRIRLYEALDGSTVYTASGSLMKGTSQEADNGLVFLVERIIMPAFETAMEYLTNDGRFTKLIEAISKAGLKETFTDVSERSTLFAPPDSAFNKIPEDYNSLIQPENKEKLRTLVKYHLLSDVYYKAGLMEKTYKEANSQYSVSIKHVGALTMVNNANVTIADVNLKNGVVHVIDNVLIPPTKAEVSYYIGAIGNFSKFVTNVASLDLTSKLQNNPVTILAPVNSAFDKIALTDTVMKSILTYHIINEMTYSNYLRLHTCINSSSTYNMTSKGNSKNHVYRGLHPIIHKGNIYINNGKIIQPDITVGNGVVHWIDRLIMPPQGSMHSYLTDVKRSSNFSSFVSLYNEFKKIIQTPKTAKHLYTYIVPTNDALQNLDDDDLNPYQILAIVQHHLLNGAWYCRHFEHDQLIMTLYGESIRTRHDANGTLYFGTARVVQGDITVDDGVIHIVENVLVPNKFATLDAADFRLSYMSMLLTVLVMYIIHYV